MTPNDPRARKPLFLFIPGQDEIGVAEKPHLTCPHMPVCSKLLAKYFTIDKHLNWFHSFDQLILNFVTGILSHKEYFILWSVV